MFISTKILLSNVVLLALTKNNFGSSANRTHSWELRAANTAAMSTLLQSCPRNRVLFPWEPMHMIRQSKFPM